MKYVIEDKCSQINNTYKNHIFIHSFAHSFTSANPDQCVKLDNLGIL